MTIGGYKIWFFNDVGELDYVDSVVAPDDREGEYSSWSCEPIEILTEEEFKKLEVILYGAT